MSAAPTTLRPSALGEGWRRTWSLALTLAASEWKLRFYGSTLGYVWSLVRPFMLFGVIYVVFVEFAKIGAGVRHFPVYILFCMVLFQFFAETTSGSLSSLVEREGLLRKVRFPRVVIPVSVALMSLFNVAGTLFAAVVFALASGAYPNWGWLWIPVLLAIVAVFAVGVGMLLSALFVRYRDVKPIWDVVVQTMFYGSPVLYVTTIVPEDLRAAYTANPLAAVFTQLRHSLLDPTAPTAAQAIGGAVYLLIPAGIVLGAFVLGWTTFKRQAPRIAEHL